MVYARPALVSISGTGYPLQSLNLPAYPLPRISTSQDPLSITHGNSRGIVTKQEGTLCFTMAEQPPVYQGLLIIEDSWSHSETPHSAGLLWTSDQPDAETPTWQRTTLTQQGTTTAKTFTKPM
jgi:hypothetical protein